MIEDVSRLFICRLSALRPSKFVTWMIFQNFDGHVRLLGSIKCSFDPHLIRYIFNLSLQIHRNFNSFLIPFTLILVASMSIQLPIFPLLSTGPSPHPGDWICVSTPLPNDRVPMLCQKVLWPLSDFPWWTKFCFHFLSPNFRCSQIMRNGEKVSEFANIYVD